MQQLAQLQLKQDEALHSYFIQAQKFSERPVYAGEQLSEPLLNAMVLNGLPEDYEHFVVQESSNPAGSFIELQTRLLNYEESRKQRKTSRDVDSHVAMTYKEARLNDISSSKYNASPMSNSRKLKCFCCGMKGHIKTKCYEKYKVACSYFRQKRHLMQVCMKKSRFTEPGSLASSPKSDRPNSEATEQDLVVDSGSTDHIVVNKNLFKSLRKLDTTVTNSRGGNSKVLRLGQIEVVAKDAQNFSF